jgi:hypothetical protein
MRLLNVCQACVKCLYDFFPLAIQLRLEMKFRRREKQIGVRLRADQHVALREIAQTEGYESVSEFVRVLLEKAIKEHDRKRKS